LKTGYVENIQPNTMKKLITIILILAAGHAFAVNRYFDATNGNDSNTGTQASPYKTITKLNTLFASMSNGDSVLFKRCNNRW